MYLQENDLIDLRKAKFIVEGSSDTLGDKPYFLTESYDYYQEGILDIPRDIYNKVKEKLTSVFMDNDTQKAMKAMDNKIKNAKTIEQQNKKAIDDMYAKNNITGKDRAAVESIIKETVDQSGNKSFNDALKIFLNKIKSAFTDIKPMKWIAGIAMAYAVAYLNGRIWILVAKFTGLSLKAVKPYLAMFVAPITEELYKVLSIKQDNIGEFFVSFNILEFVSYIFNPDCLKDFTSNGYSVTGGMSLFIILRIFCVISHGIMTVFHIQGYDFNKKNFTNIFRSLTASLLHFLHNSCSGVYIVALLMSLIGVTFTPGALIPVTILLLFGNMFWDLIFAGEAIESSKSSVKESYYIPRRRYSRYGRYQLV